VNLARTIVVALAGFYVLAGQALGESGYKPALTKPAEVFQGDIVEVKIPGVGFRAVEGRMGKETIPFYLSDRGHYTALIGTDLEAKPGPAIINVTTTSQTGARHETRITLKIKTKPFKKESFSVPAEFEQLGPEVLERIKKDQEQFSRAFMSSAPERLWEAPFLLPVPGDITSPFGYRRVINGTSRAPHTGVDLKAAMGSEVFASNHGRVVLLGDFFFSGNSVVLDHGGGLYTVYFHLSELKVATRSSVRKGEVIGLAGMTGRVTGPHLHWGARLNGARIDPFELIKKLAGNSEKAREAHGPLKGAERQDGQQRSVE
jgi:murein DD-endopeptidase MepM/ murein hydrolase activator NlpD